MTFDHDFTAWQTFEALRTLYICPIVMKTYVNDRKLITSSNGLGLNAISQCFKAIYNNQNRNGERNETKQNKTNCELTRESKHLD